MKKIVGLRNKMVHCYEEIDYGYIYDSLNDIILNLGNLIREDNHLIERFEHKEDRS